jgi:hypothetical protein
VCEAFILAAFRDLTFPMKRVAVCFDTTAASAFFSPVALTAHETAARLYDRLFFHLNGQNGDAIGSFTFQGFREHFTREVIAEPAV